MNSPLETGPELPVDTLNAQALADEVSADACLVFRRDGQLLQVADHWPPRPAAAEKLQINIGFGVSGLVARSGRSARLPTDSPRNPRHRNAIGLDPGVSVARLCVPALGVERTVVGVLSMYRDPARPFTDAEQQRLEELAPEVGIRMHAEQLWQASHAHRSERDRLIEQAISAQEAERRRIAFDLHDGVTTALASMTFRLSAAELSISELGDEPGAVDAKRELRAAADLADLAYQQTRAAITGLHSLVLDDLGLVAALEAATQAGACDDTSVDLFVDPDATFDELPDHVAAALYRVAQETLANALKHARAERIVLSLRHLNDSIVLGCADDGVGFDPERVFHERFDSSPAPGGPVRDHLGMSSIAERCALIEASLRVESLPGRGTTVLVEWPLPSD